MRRLRQANEEKCSAYNVDSYPTVFLLSPLYGLTAEWEVTSDMSDDLPSWIRSTKVGQASPDTHKHAHRPQMADLS